MEPTNHPFRKEHDLPNLHEHMFHVNLPGCILLARCLDHLFGIPTGMPAWKDSPSIHQSLWGILGWNNPLILTFDPNFLGHPRRPKGRYPKITHYIRCVWGRLPRVLYHFFRAPPFSLWQTHSHTWRIISVSKWLVAPIYKAFGPFWKGPITPVRGLIYSPCLLTTYKSWDDPRFLSFPCAKTTNHPTNTFQRSWGSNTFQCSRITLRWRPRTVWGESTKNPWVGGWGGLDQCSLPYWLKDRVV